MNARVLLVDDHPMMCTGLRVTLEKGGGLEVVGEAEDGPTALARFRELNPDLVMLDVVLGKDDGISVAAEMLAERPQTKVIIFSALCSAEVVDRALSVGVMGYLVKGKAERELVQAARQVLAGNYHLCVDVANQVLANYRRLLARPATSAEPLLTSREMEVLKLTAEGLRVKEIALRLSIGVKTVDTHRSNLLAKLKCTSVAELTRYAVREGVINP